MRSSQTQNPAWVEIRPDWGSDAGAQTSSNFIGVRSGGSRSTAISTVSASVPCVVGSQVR